MMLKSRKTAGFAMILGMMLCFAMGAYAADGFKTVEAVVRSDFNVKVDGSSVEMDSSPLVYNNRTYLPLAELGQMIGTDIAWEGETKTIYINRLVDVDPVYEVEENDAFDATYFMNMTASYQGREHPVLLAYKQYGEEYVRLNDLIRMGINTNGFPIVKEGHSEDYFVSMEEVEKVAGELDLSYSYDGSPNVTGETDEEKIDVLKEFVPLKVIFYEEDEEEEIDQEKVESAIIYTIDKVEDENDDNHYEALVLDGQNYYNLDIYLRQKESVGNTMKWYIEASEAIYEFEDD